MFAFAKRRCAYDDYDNSSEDDYSDDSNSPPAKITISSDDEDDGNDRNDSETQLRKKLLQVLRGISKLGSPEFAVGKVCPELTPIPGIRIPGYGDVSLPVTNNSIENIKEHFQQAPYGLGEATLIDKAVRDSWQLDPDKFEITNPQFNAGVNKLVQDVKNSLGCSELNVTSHLYKLLLYEPGGHFKPHRDTEKYPGMFATLIIQVPSVFTGGDLVVKHNSQEKRVVFGADEAPFQCIYAAHYADCEHELTEIKSGYRTALVYSLCWDGNGVVPRPPDISTNNLADLLKQIPQVLSHPSMLAWGLDHQYSNNSLVSKGAEALKGSDKLIYSSLQGANNLLDDNKKLELFIVEAKKLDKLYGDCVLEYGSRWMKKDEDCFEYADDGEVDFEFSVIGVDGKLWKTSRQFFDIDVSKDVLNVGKDDDTFWGTCHYGKCTGPSGNEGATKTNWYRRYLLVIITKESAFKSVYKSCLNNTLNYLQQQVYKNGAVGMKDEINEIVNLCVKSRDRFCSNKNSVTTLLKVLTMLKDLEQTKKILTMLSTTFKKYCYIIHCSMDSSFGICSDEVAKALAEVVSTFDWSEVEQDLRKMIETTPAWEYGHIITFLASCPTSVPKVELFKSIIETIANKYKEDEGLSSIGKAVFKSRKSCPQFVNLFLEFPGAQSLVVLTDIISSLKKKEGNSKDIQKDRYYKLACSKLLDQLQKVPQGGKITKDDDVEAIVKAVQFFHEIQDNDNLLKLVNGIVDKASHTLLKKLVSCPFMLKEKPPSESTKILIKARIAQLTPIVQAGKPDLSFRKPHASIPDHPDVEEFLKGPEKCFEYSNFTFKDEAQSFKHKYFIGQRLASVRIVCSRDEVRVVLTKVPPDEKKLRKEFEKDCVEYKKLKSRLRDK